MTTRMKLPKAGNPALQGGVTTLAITLILLVIITLMVIFSTNVGFFEQKTTTNENRARISQHAAEYALNLGGEYLKSNRDNLISNTVGSGWLATGASKRWAKCVDKGTADADFPVGHPCLSERDLTRRANLYFWTLDGTINGSQLIPYRSVIPANAQVENGMGGASAFPTTSNVRALLCRLDTSDPADVHCALDPVVGNRVALTLISDASLTNESGATGAVKETWGTFSTFVPSATVPLVVSGEVTGLGNGAIVASPDSGANGKNLMASIWSPNNVDDGGSYITCQFSEFTNQLVSEMTMRDVKTTCPGTYGVGSSPPCNCPKAPDINKTVKEDFSGHTTGPGAVFHKGNDILDVAAAGEPVCNSTINTITPNCRTLPSITFFPSVNSSGTAMDHGNVDNDDSVFEYIFGVNYEAANPSDGTTLTNCGSPATNCLEYAMLEDFGATVKTCADLDSASAASLSGMIYVVGPCTSLSKTIGSIDNPAIVVIQQGSTTLKLQNGMLMYGMLFVHSDTNQADVTGTNPQFYGSLVVEGDIKMTGKFLIVYDDVGASSDPHKLPKSAKFGRVPGSWLDAKTAF